MKEVLASLGATSVLTVSDLPRFRGVEEWCNSLERHNRIRFEVNATAVERAGLALSSELLKVAVNAKKKRSALRD